MSILIKGMEMPKQGRVTLQIGADGAVYVVNKCEITAEKYEKNFEVLEVPPHGRLIDADALMKSINDAREKDPLIADVYVDDYVIVSDWLRNTPTIIPSDKDGET